MLKILIKLNLIIIFTFASSNLNANQENFNIWLEGFKTRAVQNGISQTVVDDVMGNAKFLPKVIEYDRYQPEFYEDTFTYIKKRSGKSKVKKVANFTKRKKQ